MKRRDFLAAISAALAASSLPIDAAAALNPAPVINWAEWNDIQIKWDALVLRGFINGVDITAHPSLMAEVTSHLHIVSNMPHFGPPRGTLVTCPAATTQKFAVSCYVRKTTPDIQDYSGLMIFGPQPYDPF